MIFGKQTYCTRRPPSWLNGGISVTYLNVNINTEHAAISGGNMDKTARTDEYVCLSLTHYDGQEKKS